jgi:hypothetical protein
MSVSWLENSEYDRGALLLAKMLLGFRIKNLERIECSRRSAIREPC